MTNAADEKRLEPEELRSFEDEIGNRRPLTVVEGSLIWALFSEVLVLLTASVAMRQLNINRRLGDPTK
jgi:hypothetical protein